ncbi:MAG: histidine kinase [Chitinophagaceae bacterium]
MTIKLPRYTSKDYLVLAVVLLPITLLMNGIIFGPRYLSGWQEFLFTSVVSALAFSIHFTICGWIAVQLKKRFPRENEVSKRLALMIATFILLTGLFLLILFKGYERIAFLDYTFNSPGFVWAYMGMAILNIFLTLLHEGIARYESWKANLTETEALKKVYRQGRLLGLKSQVNPHFLFNSLNSLSSLIHEDEKKGEKFLDEMSKVYRYMLHNDEEQLVQLSTELKFLDSYFHLLRVRHTEGLQMTVAIAEAEKEKWLPPLTLQTVVENVVSQNAICKECPLEISLHSDREGNIIITNNLMPKLISEPQEAAQDPGLENLVKKYKLLNRADVLIETVALQRTITIPLISNKEEVMV